jgi:GR25 family glycosyltransferase involved in LPS biosynthesis
MAKECQDQAKKFNIDAEFFNGIFGGEADDHYKITNVPRPKKKLKKGRPGVLGCFFSHYYLWEKCVKENIPFLILEHDGYIIKPIPDDILNKFDDVLKLDRCDPYSGDYNIVLDKEQDFKLIVEKYWNRDAKNPVKIGTGNYFKGAYAYLLKPEGAKKLLDFIHKNENKIGHRTADQQIGDAVLNTHTTIPSLARLHPFYSIGDNLKTMSLTGNPDLLKIL